MNKLYGVLVILLMAILFLIGLAAGLDPHKPSRVSISSAIKRLWSVPKNDSAKQSTVRKFLTVEPRF